MRVFIDMQYNFLGLRRIHIHGPGVDTCHGHDSNTSYNMPATMRLHSGQGYEKHFYCDGSEWVKEGYLCVRGPLFLLSSFAGRGCTVAAYPPGRRDVRGGWTLPPLDLEPSGCGCCCCCCCCCGCSLFAFLGMCGYRWAGLCWAGLGWAGLGGAGLGWAGLCWAGRGWAWLGGWAGLGLG